MLEATGHVCAEVRVLILTGAELKNYASWLQVRMARVGFYLASGNVSW